MYLLEKIEEELLENIDSKVRLILETGHYLIKGGGKRVRPLLTLLSCGMCGGNPEVAVKLGVGLEYIHAASLLHDDVVDGAEKRRGKDSANLLFGNGVAVLTGDYMYAKALHLFSTYGTMEMIRIVSKAVMDMAEGQVLELSKVGELISEDEYFRIIDGKTSALFGACTAVGGLAGGCKEKDKLYSIGLSLGRAFQLIDDLLDYIGSVDKLGKPTGNDIKEGKATYPLISVVDSIGRERVEELLRKPNITNEEVEELREMVIDAGGDKLTKERAEAEIERVKKLLSEFGDSEYREKISEIADFIIYRNV